MLISMYLHCYDFQATEYSQHIIETLQYHKSSILSSLMKMVVNFAKSSGELNRNQLEHSIKRNFGGFDPDDFNPLDTFLKCCPSMSSLKQVDENPPTDAIGLIKSSLSGNVTALQGSVLFL